MDISPLENWVVKKSGIDVGNQKALEQFWIEKIKETLTYVKKSSRFYENLLSHVDVDSIQDLNNFRKIPFTTPQNLIDYPYGFLCVPQKDISRIVTINTSGTTGDGKRIFFTEGDLQETVDFFKHGMDCLTNPKDRVLVLLPGKAYGTIGDLLKKALQQSSTYCVIYGLLDDVDKVERIIKDNSINCIIGVPLQVLYFSRSKPGVFKKHIEKVLLSTDYVPKVLVKELYTLYNCNVYNHYGMTEMGYGGGVECAALSGYHLRECDLYMEIIDPETGQAQKDGEYGEVVFTTFNREAMPLIRYRTGDIARIKTEACKCGTFLRTMETLLGRQVNTIFIGNNIKLHLRQLDEIILAVPFVMDFIASYSKAGVLELKVQIIKANEVEKVHPQILKSLEKNLSQYIENGLKFNLKIEHIGPFTPMQNSMIKRCFHDQRKSKLY